MAMGPCEYVMVHTILPSSPVMWWIELGGKIKGFPWVPDTMTSNVHKPHIVSEQYVCLAAVRKRQKTSLLEILKDLKVSAGENHLTGESKLKAVGVPGREPRRPSMVSPRTSGLCGLLPASRKAGDCGLSTDLAARLGMLPARARGELSGRGLEGSLWFPFVGENGRMIDNGRGRFAVRPDGDEGRERSSSDAVIDRRWRSGVPGRDCCRTTELRALFDLCRVGVPGRESWRESDPWRLADLPRTGVLGRELSLALTGKSNDLLFPSGVEGCEQLGDWDPELMICGFIISIAMGEQQRISFSMVFGFLFRRLRPKRL